MDKNQAQLLDDYGVSPASIIEALALAGGIDTPDPTKQYAISYNDGWILSEIDNGGK